MAKIEIPSGDRKAVELIRERLAESKAELHYCHFSFKPASSDRTLAGALVTRFDINLLENVKLTLDWLIKTLEPYVIGTKKAVDTNTTGIPVFPDRLAPWPDYTSCSRETDARARRFDLPRIEIPKSETPTLKLVIKHLAESETGIQKCLSSFGQRGSKITPAGALQTEFNTRRVEAIKSTLSWLIATISEYVVEDVSRPTTIPDHDALPFRKRLVPLRTIQQTGLEYEKGIGGNLGDALDRLHRCGIHTYSDLARIERSRMPVSDHFLKRLERVIQLREKGEPYRLSKREAKLLAPFLPLEDKVKNSAVE
jgi:hypothetical protein